MRYFAPGSAFFAVHCCIDLADVEFDPDTRTGFKARRIPHDPAIGVAGDAVAARQHAAGVEVREVLSDGVKTALLALDNAVGGTFEASGEGFKLAAAGGDIRTPGGQPQAEAVGAGLAGGKLLVRSRLEALGKVGQSQVGLLDALPGVDQSGG